MTCRILLTMKKIYGLLVNHEETKLEIWIFFLARRSLEKFPMIPPTD